MMTEGGEKVHGAARGRGRGRGGRSKPADRGNEGEKPAAEVRMPSAPVHRVRAVYPLAPREGYARAAKGSDTKTHCESPLQPPDPAPQVRSAAHGADGGDRGGRRFGRGGGRGRGRMVGRRGEGGNGDLAKLTISVDADGVAAVVIRVLLRRDRDRDLQMERVRQERAAKRADERKEREARKADAAYRQARNLAVALTKDEGKMNLSKALEGASKFVMQAQRSIDAKSEQMEQMGLRAGDEGAEAEAAQAEMDTNLVVQLCAEIQEINKHVRQVLTAILRHKDGDEMTSKQQDRLLELLLLLQEWSNAFDASPEPLPAWLKAVCMWPGLWGGSVGGGVASRRTSV
jgi:hypothetical protein